MPNKKDIEEVAAIVNSEGLGYAVMGYMSADSIADPKLAELWAAADKALYALDKYIESKVGDIY